MWPLWQTPLAADIGGKAVAAAALTQGQERGSQGQERGSAILKTNEEK